MVEIIKDQIGRVINVHKIIIDQEDYDYIQELRKTRSTPSMQTEVVKKYHITRTEAFKLIRAVENNYKYLEIRSI